MSSTILLINVQFKSLSVTESGVSMASKIDVSQKTSFVSVSFFCVSARFRACSVASDCVSDCADAVSGPAAAVSLADFCTDKASKTASTTDTATKTYSNMINPPQVIFVF
jgi:hypothetical protein